MSRLLNKTEQLQQLLCGATPEVAPRNLLIMGAATFLFYTEIAPKLTSIDAYKLYRFLDTMPIEIFRKGNMKTIHRKVLYNCGIKTFDLNRAIRSFDNISPTHKALSEFGDIKKRLRELRRAS